LSPGGITLGPWLGTVTSLAPTLSCARLERSRHTSVGSWLSDAAWFSMTRVALPGVPPVAAGMLGMAQVISVADTVGVPAPLRAAVKLTPRGAVTVTRAPVTAASVGFVTMIREG
jgi:hypothetical protein